ncbi:uncharacterized protein LOC100482398 isoform X3 [Ailuropoda melanoleuca]|uniref:uncharacterized protein LOC100482398 isoform X3 n=1 Tax=Ailuropoda melanoleuca TaxID=9646 RepID=UPI000947B570|nr:uncharacterized protein LOC100482398 isoform X3 [Ailuropoda melanoleuca]
MVLGSRSQSLKETQRKPKRHPVSKRGGRRVKMEGVKEKESEREAANSRGRGDWKAASAAVHAGASAAHQGGTGHQSQIRT